MLEDDFLACVCRRDLVSLLILACYVVLLRTMRNIWNMDVWAEQILVNIREEAMGNIDMARWMEWPLKVSGLLDPEETETNSV
ncbi:hypothetical protein EDB81DRAFT_234875 [Dactylonectria macrodidyma]|uniref:Uncharacterized protein n=1 Tax=Dactylonectria macrodidyma TaxID=307937 RepID=A0A9P9DHR1_9HYPO|nr:hypothetical protein EDB81DRAFT_234875 [Dactylonectria macrodidyma]